VGSDVETEIAAVEDDPLTGLLDASTDVTDLLTGGGDNGGGDGDGDDSAAYFVSFDIAWAELPASALDDVIYRAKLISKVRTALSAAAAVPLTSTAAIPAAATPQGVIASAGVAFAVNTTGTIAPRAAAAALAAALDFARVVRLSPTGGSLFTSANGFTGTIGDADLSTLIGAIDLASVLITTPTGATFSLAVLLEFTPSFPSLSMTAFADPEDESLFTEKIIEVISAASGVPEDLITARLQAGSVLAPAALYFAIGGSSEFTTEAAATAEAVAFAKILLASSNGLTSIFTAANGWTGTVAGVDLSAVPVTIPAGSVKITSSEGLAVPLPGGKSAADNKWKLGVGIGIGLGLGGLVIAGSFALALKSRRRVFFFCRNNTLFTCMRIFVSISVGTPRLRPSLSSSPSLSPLTHPPHSTSIRPHPSHLSPSIVSFHRTRVITNVKTAKIHPADPQGAVVIVGGYAAAPGYNPAASPASAYGAPGGEPDPALIYGKGAASGNQQSII
jgi:hypothetical protein